MAESSRTEQWSGRAGVRQQELASERRVSRLVEEVRRSHKKKMIPKANFIHFLILPKVSTVPKKKETILCNTSSHKWSPDMIRLGG